MLHAPLRVLSHNPQEFPRCRIGLVRLLLQQIDNPLGPHSHASNTGAESGIVRPESERALVELQALIRPARLSRPVEDHRIVIVEFGHARR